MVSVHSTMLPLGTEAPAFDLPDPAGGGRVSLEQLGEAPAFLIIFLSNHCPYVQHIAKQLGVLTRGWVARGVAVVGINSNDVHAYPDDAPEQMVTFARQAGWEFPYLFDEDQSVAKAYRAACTPDFFLFDGDRRLVYRGQFDDSRPGNDRPVTGADLEAAVDAVLSGRPVPGDQHPSLGCNIKWKPGNEPDYFG